MTFSKRLVVTLISVIPFFVSAGGSFVFLKDTTQKLFFVNNNEIYSPGKNQLLYFQKGNIFFSGGSDDKQNIFLLCTSMDPTTTDLALIYEKDEHDPAYSFRDNKFYLGKTESDDMRQKNELLHLERSKKWLAFYASANDSLLAYYRVDSVPPPTAVIVAYTLIKNFALEKKMAAQQNEVIPFIKSDYSTIKPAWGNATANEWMWDGKILRPRWNIDQNLMWTFDGQIIKQMYVNNIDGQYSWDGENFKPLWKQNNASEWSWDGHYIKPIWDTNLAHRYVMEDGVVKPWSGDHTEGVWYLDGTIPIPLIILIISGIARPN